MRLNNLAVLFTILLMAAGCSSSQTTTGMRTMADPPAIPVAPPASADTAVTPPAEPLPELPVAAALPAVSTSALPAVSPAELPDADTTWVSLADQAVRSVSQAQYRVQIFASRSLESVKQVVNRARALQDDPVRIVTTATLYKVHVGDYPDREAAQRQRARLRALNWPDAWIVAVQPGVPEAAPPAAGSSQFTVQVLASGSRDLARNLLRRLLEDGFAASHIVFDEQLWKVRAGACATREDAALLQQQIAARGYPDAWVLPLEPARNDE